MMDPRDAADEAAMAILRELIARGWQPNSGEPVGGAISDIVFNTIARAVSAPSEGLGR